MSNAVLRVSHKKSKPTLDTTKSEQADNGKQSARRFNAYE